MLVLLLRTCVLVSHLDLTVSIMHHVLQVNLLHLLILMVSKGLEMLLFLKYTLHCESCLHVRLLWLRLCLSLSLLLNLLRVERRMTPAHHILPVLLRP